MKKVQFATTLAFAAMVALSGVRGFGGKGRVRVR